MTELVILSAVEQLERLLDEKAAALQGAEEQAEGLKSDLTLMLGFLTESARSRSRNHLTSQVREMAHDAKAIIDDAWTIIESQELESVCLRLRLRLESIRSRFREASDRIQSGVEDEEDVGRPHQPMTPSEGDDVVGFEEDVEDLIDSVLFYGKEYQNTIMIKGMGGMGKTTLAREVYNHAAVVDGFEHRAWACVSGEVSPEEVLRVLIAQVAELSEDELKMLKGNMHVQSLQQMLRQHLEGTRYFIVLDDVWDYTYIKPVITALPSLEYNQNSSQFHGDNLRWNLGTPHKWTALDIRSGDLAWWKLLVLFKNMVSGLRLKSGGSRNLVADLHGLLLLTSMRCDQVLEEESSSTSTLMISTSRLYTW